ncbi:hypothetical protein SAMN02746041_02118 [Desulfacinum hydrothermale DSM 13146]|uniref:DUF1573 domain-containing protein n=1 Tax=Desulfacinum hydrothermale DSM 13146 TaxID=1121390 RepID=A0A1W1XLX9_9BACT|nr:DUF1573 domain-containing protein [Desulfacinum hydrothermale]SMC24862.1 hypothetical protein SAMN02746041_02118 [Desulfacinum hydrothermale DSM 13146]
MTTAKSLGKWILAGCLVLLMGAGLPAVGVQTAGAAPKAAKKATEEPRPVIQVDRTHVDLGEVDEGRALVHDFVVKNVGKAPLHIERVRPG